MVRQGRRGVVTSDAETARGATAPTTLLVLRSIIGLMSSWIALEPGTSHGSPWAFAVDADPIDHDFAAKCRANLLISDAASFGDTYATSRSHNRSARSISICHERERRIWSWATKHENPAARSTSASTSTSALREARCEMKIRVDLNGHTSSVERSAVDEHQATASLVHVAPGNPSLIGLRPAVPHRRGRSCRGYASVATRVGASSA